MYLGLLRWFSINCGTRELVLLPLCKYCLCSFRFFPPLPQFLSGDCPGWSLPDPSDTWHEVPLRWPSSAAFRSELRSQTHTDHPQGKLLSGFITLGIHTMQVPRCRYSDSFPKSWKSGGDAYRQTMAACMIASAVLCLPFQQSCGTMTNTIAAYKDLFKRWRADQALLPT